MKVMFDPEADALTIRLADAPVEESEEVSPGVILDYDAEGRVIAIEVLNAKAKLPAAELRQVLFEVA